LGNHIGKGLTNRKDMGVEAECKKFGGAQCMFKGTKHPALKRGVRVESSLGGANQQKFGQN